LAVIHSNCKDAYTKGPLYCVMLKDKSVYKYPICSIFRIREEP